MKLAINGFGRIGRNVFKIAFEKGIDIVAINDLTDPKTLAHLLKYDSTFGVYNKKVESRDGAIVVDGREIKIIAERDPKNLPWAKLGIDVVIESTGVFSSATSNKGGYLDHVNHAGAKKVILTVPAKDEIKTIVLGVNDHDINSDLKAVSNASCTTNCLAPLAKVLHESFGIEQGLMTTVHAYTNDQRILDLPHSDLRRARAAALSIIPTSTGAAKAVGLVLPELKGKLNGTSMRVPVPTGSIVDLTVQLKKKDVTKEEINSALRKASETPELKGILGYTEDPIVSSDIKGNSHSSIVDGLETMVLENGFAKVLSWYDNEFGYSTRVVDLAQKLVK
ncbi:type I glyceraldehyde-3-phosphate dehydrogenase [Borreliella lusitaniae]|uniref:type I glyceraldehyde-3-phosphate dehydrogenase n=1 Tax=Borreliella lusitaniae TaxID=100177 RepID=UPI00292E0755|nr:type I glyceraldehyde-3-phosphate dehydrogenase [Borreliella lusitaniae]WNY66446.1 type I glyceraldehyde-3-phosphate dehydrogenase [Borreliella lusitaniae]